MRNSENTEQMLIGKSISRTSSVNVLDVNSSSYLADGEIVVLDENDNPLVGGTTYPASRYIKIVQRSGSPASGSQLVQSARISGNNIISYRGLSYQAPQEQISYIGYDGTSGAIDATSVSDYVVRITLKHNKDMWSQQSNTRIERFTPSVNTTNTDIADYFAVRFANDSFLNPEVTVERISNNAGTVTPAGVGTLTWTKGSKVMTTSGTTPATTSPVGSYIRLGLGTTDAIYKVTAVSNASQTITVDQPVQQNSGSLTVGLASYMSAATAQGSDLGIKFVGIPQNFIVLKYAYVKVKFDITVSGFGATTVTRFQESKPGSGTYEQIATIEKFAQGFEGIIDRVGDSAPTGRTDAVAGTNYDVIVIEYFNTFDVLPVSGAKPAKAVLSLAIVDGAAQTTNILAQLNPWMASLPQNFTAVSV